MQVMRRLRSFAGQCTCEALPVSYRIALMSEPGEIYLGSRNITPALVVRRGLTGGGARSFGDGGRTGSLHTQHLLRLEVVLERRGSGAAQHSAQCGQAAKLLWASI